MSPPSTSEQDRSATWKGSDKSAYSLSAFEDAHRKHITDEAPYSASFVSGLDVISFCRADQLTKASQTDHTTQR